MLTANEIISRAGEIAKTNYTDALGNAQGMVAIAQSHLNAILSDLCMEQNLALARGFYTFTLSPTQTSVVNGIANFGGPYPLPLDYLRASASAGADGTQTGFWYVFQQSGQVNQPLPLLPWDLGRYDMLTQLPNQSLPTLYATDMSPESTANDRIVLRTTATTASGANSVLVNSATGLAIGLGCAGQGIATGSVITNIAGTTITLSLNATGTFNGASVFFGIAPNAYIWPGSNGAYPAFLRYQRWMPPIVDFTRVPWFTHDGYLIAELAARLMGPSGDSRREEYHAIAQERLSSFTKLKDDLSNRAQRVILDANRFSTGSARWTRLATTKAIGWP